MNKIFGIMHPIFLALVSGDSSSRVPYGFATCSEYLNRFPLRKCDGNHDCGNEEDEQNCDGCIGIHNRPFHCNGTNKCIEERLQCDGIDDCGNDSDEADCGGCKGMSVRTLQCKNSTKCIEERLKCDGHIDCIDGFDEDACDNCIGIENRPFQCSGTTKCIQEHIKCDGQDDCDDGSDEVACNATDCAEHVRLHPHRKCDGIKNCGNGADEEDCSTCPANRMFKCGNTTQCISDSLKCNGEPGGCFDGSDEDEALCNFYTSNINCEWDDWSEWNNCITCESAMKQRTRGHKVEPQYGGQACRGKDTEFSRCTGDDCPACGGLLEGRDGNFSSNGYFATNTECRWLIQGDENEMIEFVFTHMDLKANDEYIALYDGSDTNSTQIAMLRGRILNPIIYVSTSQHMVIRLRRNAGTTSQFSANYTRVLPCVMPSIEGYNLTDVDANILTIDHFNVPVSCALGYTGLASAEKCSHPGEAFTLHGCIEDACSINTDAETCISSTDRRLHTKYAGEHCIWCCGNACTHSSASMCEPLNYLIESTTWNKSGRNPHVMDTCPRPPSCPEVKDEKTCVVSRDGRINIYKDSPCVWCCGVPCSSNGHICEPWIFLHHDKNWDRRGRGKNFDTCNRTH